MSKIIQRFVAILLVVCISFTNFNGVIAKSKELSINVEGVGVFDINPAIGIADYGSSRLFQVTFNKTFYNISDLDANGTKQWVQNELGQYIIINGKTVSEWNNLQFNSVQIHVKTSSTIGGQYLEINCSNLTGLPLVTIDNTVKILSGFPDYYGDSLGHTTTFVYTSNINLPFKQLQLDVEGVGVFDCNPNIGMVDYGTSRLFQITFNKEFYDKNELDTNGTKQWVQEELGQYIEINGKTADEWNELEYNSVQIHVKTLASIGGQYLEVICSDLNGLPLLTTDNTIKILSGFPDYYGETLKKTSTFLYIGNTNVPFKPLIDVEKVGVFDSNPAIGIVDFGSTRLFHVVFNKNFYNIADLDANGTKLWVQSEFGEYIQINGKTVNEWNNLQFNSVQIHVKTSASIGGQYLEINCSNLAGLPLVTTDNTVKILSGFPDYYGDSLENTTTFLYRSNINLPFKQLELDVGRVGIFDLATEIGMIDFGSSRLFQITFNKDFYSKDKLDSNGTKLWVQSELGKYIEINGKTVDEWNNLQYNSVQVHVKTLASLGGQYLEVICSDLDGLPLTTIDNAVKILSEFPNYYGASLEQSTTFMYCANSNVPFERLLDVEGIGIFDHNLATGMMDFGTSRLFQITFNKEFYNKNELDSNGAKLWVQSELGQYIEINGKTVDEWNSLVFNSVQIHVRTLASIGGQYLEVICSDLAGLPLVTANNTVKILSGFPVYNGIPLTQSIQYTYTANENAPFARLLNENNKAAFLSWEFDNDLEEFSAENANISTNNGDLSFTGQTGGYLITPNNLSIPSVSIKTVEMRLKSSNSSSLKLYWRVGNQAFSSANSAAISVKSDNLIHDYQFDLSRCTGWAGNITQLKFEIVSSTSKNIVFDNIQLTGLYFVPFVFISGNLQTDIGILSEVKRSFSISNKNAIVGFSILTEYLADTDANGDYNNRASGNLHDPKYFVELAKLMDMPVMIWLRGDPWGNSQSGIYNNLWGDNNSTMWTSATDNSRFYRNTVSGYGNLCLASNDLDGNKTAYWSNTEKLLKQCADEVDLLIEDNPGYILGVTTTSEYKFSTENNLYDLDYNPKTIKEFRDYCQNKYTTISNLNAACSTSFTSFNLLSTDYNPATIENAGGFDAPRVRYTPSVFWNEWTTFRGNQIKNAVQHLADIIGESIDSKYIYTHQIPYGDNLTASPIESGDVLGANVGIDFFNSEVNDENMLKIQNALGNDCSRSWGCPEWLVTIYSSYSQTYDAFTKMLNSGIKYICPFNWGGNDDFDIKGTPSENACRDILQSLISVMVSGVALDYTSTTIGKQVTKQLTSTVSPSNADNQGVTWSSSNTAVATVNSSGLVTGVGTGNATITATTAEGSFTAACIVTVKRYDPARYYKITYDSNSTLAMDSTTTGLNGVVKNVTYTGADSQKWQVIETTDANTFKIVNKATGYALKVNSTTNSTNKQIIQTTYASANNMNFTISESSTYVQIVSKLGSSTYIKCTGTSGGTLVTAASTTTTRWDITLVS